MFKNNQILYMSFQCTDVYGCPKLLDMNASAIQHAMTYLWVVVVAEIIYSLLIAHSFDKKKLIAPAKRILALY